MIREIKADIRAVESGRLKAIISNRGFHALLFYRLANFLWHKHIPVIPLILTRVIQILYGIDIDWRARIGAGCVIVHGVGVVIGMGATIGPGTKIYHGVTLGIAHSGNADGFPTIGRNCLIGAGAKVLGNITIGDNARVGANAVVLKDIPSYAIAVGVPAQILTRKD
jgi:serine O-acetyltransferase